MIQKINTKVIVGVDVGGTNTDAVVITKINGKNQLLSYGKELTTPDVTSGVKTAIYNVLKQVCNQGQKLQVVQVNIGTTHFVNAMVQGKDLTKVSVIRLCGTASTAMPPFSDFPQDLKNIIKGTVHLCNGGFQFDGSIIQNIDKSEIEVVINQIKKSNIQNIVIAGIFSPVRDQHQIQVQKIVNEIYPQASVTLSHKLGNLGLLERQNAAILNQCIKPLSKKTIDGFKQALADLNIEAELYLTQNDGSILGSEDALKYPIYSFASGPTNSMRGAMFLCSKKDAIVLDIGGTTTDVGVLKNGFPREASTQVKLARVKTNFRMPDVVSFGLGGGSYIAYEQSSKKVAIGPLSAGYNLKNEAYIFKKPEQQFSDRLLTASDIAVAAGFLKLGDSQNVSNLPKQLVDTAINKIVQMIQSSIQMVKISDEKLPVILVGGGACLVNPNQKFKGASQVFIPKQAGVANAIGAALSQVSSFIDSVIDLQSQIDKEKLEVRKKQVADNNENLSVEQLNKQYEKIRGQFLLQIRQKALNQTIIKASNIVKNLGADQNTIQVRQRQDLTLSYIPGQATRIKVKIIGDLKWEQKESKLWEPEKIDPKKLLQKQFEYYKQKTDSQGKTLANKCVQQSIQPSKPFIDQSTGQWILSEWDIQSIAIGAGIFGCGGGGNTHLGRIRTLDDVRKGKKIRVVSFQKLYQKMDPQKDKICPMSHYGSPLATYQQLVARKEMNNALECLKDLFKIGGYQNGDLKYKQNVEIKISENGVKYIENYQPSNQADPNSKTQNIVGILISEIGGLNALQPLVVSADLGVPIIDADGMGRAFPQLGMFCPYMHGLNSYPVAMVDHKGTRAVVLQAKTAKSVEDHLRSTVIRMGCSACVAQRPLNKKQIQETTVHYSVSRVWYLGDAILKARHFKKSPIKAILQTQKSQILIIGKIKDVKRQTESGYNKGHVIVEGMEDYSGKGVKVLFQNQFIIVRSYNDQIEGKQLATVPDLISIVDVDTAQPVPTQEVKYGMRICIIVIAAPDKLKTPEALKHVSPQNFGYKGVAYKPIGDAYKIKPIPMI